MSTDIMAMVLDLIDMEGFNFLALDIITFSVDMISSTKIDNRKKGVLILGKGGTQGLEHPLSAGKMYLISFTEHNKNFCLSLHYNGASSYLVVSRNQIHKIKAKYSVATPLCLGKVSKDWTEDNMKKLDYTDMFMILVLIMMLLQLMTF